jgi:hypothetical protein
VDQILAVRGVQRGRHLTHEVHGPRRRQQAAGLLDRGLGVDAVDVAHRQPELPGLLAAVVDRHDVAVREAGDDVRLAHEPGDEVRLGGQLAVEQLQGVLAGQPRMVDQEHRTHPTRPDLADDPVAGEHVPRRELHGASCGRGGRP